MFGDCALTCAHKQSEEKERSRCADGVGVAPGKVAPAAENLFVIMHTATKAQMSLVWVWGFFFFLLLSHKQQVTTSRTNQSDKKELLTL